MKKLGLVLVVVLCLVLGVYSTGFAEMKMGKMKMGKMKMPKGEMIHSTNVAVSFNFFLIDMKGMGTGGNTHHLMVYLKDTSSKAITDAKVKFKVVAPDEEQQTAKPMAMSGGFGADINFSQKGKYEIVCQATVGKNKITTRFSHTVK